MGPDADRAEKEMKMILRHRPRLVYSQTVAVVLLVDVVEVVLVVVVEVVLVDVVVLVLVVLVVEVLVVVVVVVAPDFNQKVEMNQI